MDASSGPYNEQLIIPPVTGTSSTNTVTFNGNGNQNIYSAVTGTATTFGNLVINKPGGVL